MTRRTGCARWWTDASDLLQDVSDEQLEAELLRRRRRRTQAAGVAVRSVDWGGFMRVKLTTPRGVLVLSTSEDDGARAWLDGVEFRCDDDSAQDGYDSALEDWVWNVVSTALGAEPDEVEAAEVAVAFLEGRSAEIDGMLVESVQEG